MVPLLSTVNYRIVLKEKMNTLETRRVDFIFFLPFDFNLLSPHLAAATSSAAAPHAACEDAGLASAFI